MKIYEISNFILIIDFAKSFRKISWVTPRIFRSSQLWTQIRGGPYFGPVKYVKEVGHVKTMHANSILVNPNFWTQKMQEKKMQLIHLENWSLAMQDSKLSSESTYSLLVARHISDSFRIMNRIIFMIFQNSKLQFGNIITV